MPPVLSQEMSSSSLLHVTEDPSPLTLSLVFTDPADDNFCNLGFCMCENEPRTEYCADGKVLISGDEATGKVEVCKPRIDWSFPESLSVLSLIVGEFNSLPRLFDFNPGLDVVKRLSGLVESSDDSDLS